MTRTIQTPAAPPEKANPSGNKGGGGPQHRPAPCNSCPDVVSDKQRQHIADWFEKSPAERAAIRASRKGKPDKGGRERARDRREARDECIGDRDSARN